MKKLIGLLLFVSLSTFAQREKGKLLKIPRLNTKKTTTSTVPNSSTSEETKTTANDFEFTFEEEPKLRFSNTFEKTVVTTKPIPVEATGEITDAPTIEAAGTAIPLEPLKELNEIIHDDTSELIESDLVIVEIEQNQVYSNLNESINVASYFSVWNNSRVDPYGIDPLQFNDVIPINLYDIGQNRLWAPMLDETPITSHFGWRHGRRHFGTDIDLETGDPVYAAFDGVVRVANTLGGYGRAVILRHYNGLESLHGHMSKLYVSENQQVKAGDIIGLGGNTGRSSGSHLHYELRYEGNAFDSENVFSYENRKANILSDQFVLTSAVFDYLRGGKSIVVDTSIDFTDDQFSEITQPEQQYIEEKKYYRVHSGDNLSKIGNKFGLTANEVASMNGISINKRLSIGMRLRVQ